MFILDCETFCLFLLVDPPEVRSLIITNTLLGYSQRAMTFGLYHSDNNCITLRYCMERDAWLGVRMLRFYLDTSYVLYGLKYPCQYVPGHSWPLSHHRSGPMEHASSLPSIRYWSGTRLIRIPNNLIPNRLPYSVTPLVCHDSAPTVS